MWIWQAERIDGCGFAGKLKVVKMSLSAPKLMNRE